MEWIKCGDRLPDKDDLYLTCNSHNQIVIMTYIASDGVWRKFGATMHPAYWMPLPEPPQT